MSNEAKALLPGLVETKVAQYTSRGKGYRNTEAHITSEKQIEEPCSVSVLSALNIHLVLILDGNSAIGAHG